MDDAQTFALGGFGLSSIERHELEGLGLVLRRDECGADLKRVCRAERMCLDQPLREPFHGVYHRHLGPAWPGVEKFTPRGSDLASHARRRAPTPRKGG